MKANILILLLTPFLILTIYSCNGDEPGSEATCTDEKQNGDETGIDCGGSTCVECFDCFSDYCEFLTGSTPPGVETSKKWKCTELDGVPIDEIADCDQDLGCQINKAVRIELKSKGGAILTGLDGPESGRWSFDDPENPTALIITYDNPEGPYGVQEFIGLTSVSENEFITNNFYGKNGKFEPF